MSLGEAGIGYCDAQQRLHKAAPLCPVHSDTGAGDALTAGLVAAWVAGTAAGSPTRLRSGLRRRNAAECNRRAARNEPGAGQRLDRGLPVSEHLGITAEVSAALAAGQPVVCAGEHYHRARHALAGKRRDSAGCVSRSTGRRSDSGQPSRSSTGRLRVGLDTEEIELLARGGSDIRKCSPARSPPGRSGGRARCPPPSPPP